MLYGVGVRQNFQYYPGYPTARIQAGNKFAELGGFQVFLDLIRRPETGWLGTDKLLIIARTLSEVTLLLIVLYIHWFIFVLCIFG